MPDMVALLRAVNLGAHQRISMARLRELVRAAGYADADTYLQSGNVVFQGRGAADAQRIEQLIAAEFGHRVDVQLRDRAELMRIVSSNPFDGVADDPSRQLVAFLSDAPDRARLQLLDEAAFLPDRFIAAEREVHIWCPNGVHGSRLTTDLLARRLGVGVTARNWRTVRALAEILSA